jgi:hypothetical protein
MNFEILKKNWEPEEIRESQLNDNKLNSYATACNRSKDQESPSFA